MDHCWHTVFLTINQKTVPQLKCCFCGEYDDIPTVPGQKAVMAGHGPYTPKKLAAFPEPRVCPKR